jgi:hypothetical protein
MKALLTRLFPFRTATTRRAVASSPRRTRRRVVSLRPTLECLEERTVLSTLYVTKTLDDGTVPETLRYAVAKAQSGDTIVIRNNQLSGPIVLTGGQLDLNQNVTIKTSGPGLATVSGNQAHRIFEVGSTNPHANVSISSLVITDGAESSGIGGGIANFGTLTVRNSTLAGNFAVSGGGIFNSGTLTVQNSTLAGNFVAQDGGGIYQANGSATLIHVTLTRNVVDGAGFLDGGGLRVFGGTAMLTNTLVAGNIRRVGGRDDVFGNVTVESAGNLIGDGTGLSGISHGVNGNQVGTAASPIDPRLGPLQDNGGPTPTHALLPGSPAINAASAARALPADQRGVARDAAPDVGAFEFVPPPPPSPLPPPPPPPPRQIVAAAFRQNGKAKVRVKDAATGAVRMILTPFPGFAGRLRLLLLDVNGDGSADLMVKALINGKPKKKVYDAVTLAPLA